MSESAAGNLKSLQEAEKNKIQLLTKQNQDLQRLLAEVTTTGTDGLPQTHYLVLVMIHVVNQYVYKN